MRERLSSLKTMAVVGVLCAAVSTRAQTTVDLRTQSKTVDFTAAAFTRPIKTGVTPPASCAVGDLFFDTDAAPGANLSACVAPSTWSPLVSGGSASELAGFKVTGGGTALAVSCTACSYRIGGKVFLFAGDMGASGLTGTGAAATVFVYLDVSGTPRFGYDGTVVTGATLSGLAGQTGVTQIPADTIPVASCTVSANQFGACTDLRAVYSRMVAAAGNGIAVLENATTGTTTISVNPAVVGLLAGANTWTGVNNFASASHTLPVKTGTVANRPSTCTVGELYFATDAATAGKNLHFCTATNTWTVTP